MIPLTPMDTELDWKAVQECLSEVVPMATRIWSVAGILMPDEAADEIKLNLMDELFQKTSEALGVRPELIFPARERLRWITLMPMGEPWSIYASLDGGKPAILPRP